jgi:hypothetical protein
MPPGNRPATERRMTRLFLLPGDLLCDAFGVPLAKDHRQVLRSYFNIMIWCALAMAVALKIAL